MKTRILLLLTVLVGSVGLLFPYGVARAAPAQRTNHPAIAARPISKCNPTIKVRAGDTLSTIARRCGVSVSTLKTLNNLRSDLIRVGQILKVSSARTATPAPETPRQEPTPTPVSDTFVPLPDPMFPPTNSTPKP